jgi:ABC-type polysaccharide/polyol phosphate export permease
MQHWGVHVSQVRPVEVKPAASMTAGVRNRPPALALSWPWQLSYRIVSTIDDVIAFLALERGLILRNISIVGEGSWFRALGPALRIIAIINAHIWFFWLIGRRMPGTISYVEYNTAGFTVWSFFSVTSRIATPLTVNANFTKSTNVKWVHLFFAGAVWEWTIILLTLMATLSFYMSFPFPMLGPPMQMPNIPLMLYTFAIAAALGAGYGMVLHSAIRRWPNLELAAEVFYWFLFVSSGVYESYSLLPWYIAQFYWYFPMISIIEHCRKAMFSGYPVGDLSLLYSSALALGMLFLGLAVHRWELRTRAA